MDFLLEALTNWLKEMLVGGIMSNLSGMFDSVNQQVADISVQVGQTPQGWNGSIFNMIENLSNSIMVPIAGVILAIVMTVDLIQMIADKNNLHDVDTWMIFKWVFKSAAAILIVTNTWNIVMGALPFPAEEQLPYPLLLPLFPEILSASFCHRQKAVQNNHSGSADLRNQLTRTRPPASHNLSFHT